MGYALTGCRAPHDLELSPRRRVSAGYQRGDGPLRQPDEAAAARRAQSPHMQDQAVEASIRDATSWFADAVAAIGDVDEALDRAVLRLTGRLDGLGYEPDAVSQIALDVRRRLEGVITRLRQIADGE